MMSPWHSSGVFPWAQLHDVPVAQLWGILWHSSGVFLWHRTGEFLWHSPMMSRGTALGCSHGHSPVMSPWHSSGVFCGAALGCSHGHSPGMCPGTVLGYFRGTAPGQERLQERREARPVPSRPAGAGPDSLGEAAGPRRHHCRSGFCPGQKRPSGSGWDAGLPAVPPPLQSIQACVSRVLWAAGAGCGSCCGPEPGRVSSGSPQSACLFLKVLLYFHGRLFPSFSPKS